MIKPAQETEDQLHRVTMQKTDVVEAKSKSNSSLKNIKGQTAIKQKVVSIEPLKDSTNVTPAQATVVRIKSKKSQVGPQKDELESKEQDQETINPLSQEKQPVKEAKCKKFTTKSKLGASVKDFKTSKLLLTPKQFLLKSVESNEVTKCCILKEKGFFSDTIQIRLQGNSQKLVTYMSKFSLSGYQVFIRLPHEQKQIEAKSCDQNECFPQKYKNPNIAVIRSNFNGSMFNVYQYHKIQEQTLVASIEYCSDIGKCSGPRKVIIYYQQRVPEAIVNNFNEYENLKVVIEKEGKVNGLKMFQNCPPLYDEQKGIYCIKFGAKNKILPSTHNIIFKDDQEKPVLKFYKVEDNQYSLQCFSPLNPIIGCAYSISSFLFKLVSK